MTGKEIIDMTEEYGAHNYHPLPVVLTRGKGVWVWDSEGKKYIDMLSCYSALNHGHRHPRLIKAVKDQIKKITLTSRAFYNEQLGPLCKELAELCNMEMVLPMNSGAEAVETAIKIARKWGYKKKGISHYEAEIIVCENNFHGRTTTIVSFSTEPLYRDEFGPFTPGFKIIPFGDIDALEKAITPNTVAFLVEPIQGEAGINVPPDGFLKKAYDICKKNNVLLMFDEIQTGLGRTGKLFAYQYEDGVRPDVLILGKALGGGIYPISAVVSSKDILGLFTWGEHGSTFGGNPLAAYIARVALKVLVEEGLIQNSYEMGNYFIEQLRKIKSQHIKEIRGRGLLIGLELYKEAGGARRFCEALMNEGLLCKETHDHVIRFAPPLNIKKREINFAIKKIEKVFKELD
ncbi:MAG: ornithine--oxo-acid transaminase [Deltaproteobacteria bacterium]|nr:ornithine--oxo-acid transaminase [Deltaproteobacteria bacterium]